MAKEFRKGKRTIQVPLRGQQNFELKNESDISRGVQINLHSSRFFRPESIRKCSDEHSFKMILGSNHSVIFSILDRGFVDVEEWSPMYEGVLSSMVSEQEVVKGQKSDYNFLHCPDILLTTDPESDSFKELRASKDDSADMVPEMISGIQYNTDFISLEPIPTDKYKNGIPKNVHFVELSAEDKDQKMRQEKLFGPKKNDKNGKDEKSEKKSILEPHFETATCVRAEKSAKSSCKSGKSVVPKSEDVRIQTSSQNGNIEKKKKKKKCAIM